jgi:hypothetical protein
MKKMHTLLIDIHLEDEFTTESLITTMASTLADTTTRLALEIVFSLIYLHLISLLFY